ncbi:hypothetical protein V1514DRAFT_348508 [Lipomyces japonicus]|uniref:uncharacterized protein n=1 Tax=Lipomyces japonicus TaxID=56871 RepID=UPI0034CF6FFF
MNILFKLGSIELSNRIVLAPLTRFQNDDEFALIQKLNYAFNYAERALVPGTLLISEGTVPHIFGLYTDIQVSEWNAVTDAVHVKKSFIFLQLFGHGRVDTGDVQKSIYGPSAIANGDGPVPKEYTKADVEQLIEHFVRASTVAVTDTGFDGVEIHAAYRYLIDQFLQAVSNQRSEEYGGSIENRAKFLFDIIDLGIRLSPYSEFQSMKYLNPYPQFSYMISKLQETHSNLVYLHFSVKEYANTHMDGLVAFGRYFVSNPDLVARAKEGIPFRKYDRSTFHNAKSPEGYVGYEYAPELKGKYF